jgi:hypothetical protein
MIGWGLKSFQVPGLGRRVPGSGSLVQGLVPGPYLHLKTRTWDLKPETCDPRMIFGFRSPLGVGLSYPLTANRHHLLGRDGFSHPAQYN